MPIVFQKIEHNQKEELANSFHSLIHKLITCEKLL